MKLSTKIILPIILISALLILLNGCISTVPTDESPGYTPGTITGIIASPCCSTSADPVSETCCIAPEYWCFYCQNTWNLQDGIEVVLTYGEDEVATTTTNKYGEFTFTDVAPGKNYVITAYCPDFGDNRPLVKDVALELIEGGSFDTKITDLVSTSLGLVVDFLVLYTEWGPEDISLDEVLADRPNFPNFPKFKKLVYEVRKVVENCEVNLLTDDDVLYATCRAAEEISGLNIGCGPGYTPPYIPPTDPCAGNIAPDVNEVTLNGVPVVSESTLNLVVGTLYEFCVYATDPDNKLPQDLTYSLIITKDGTTLPDIPMGTLNCYSGTPLVGDAGTYEIFVKVFDGCEPTIWGPITVIFLTEITVAIDPDPMVLCLTGTGLPDSGTIVTTAHYSDGSSAVVTPDLYDGYNAGVVSVDVSGNVSSVGVGTTTITVHYEDKTADVPVEVKDCTYLERITVAIDPDPMVLCLTGTGLPDSGTIVTTAHYSDGSSAVVTPDLYDGYNAGVVSVDVSGNVSSVGVGTTTITVHYEDKTADVPVEVKDCTYLERITVAIDPDPMVLCLTGTGLPDSGTIVTTAHYSDGSSAVVTPDLYDGYNAGVVSVDVSGNVSSVGVGTTTITVHYEDKTADVPVEVKDCTYLERITVAIDPDPMVLCLTGTGLPDSGTIVTTAHYSDGSSAVVTPDLYDGYNAGVVSVDVSGNVSSVGVGTTTITVHYEDKTADVPVEVKDCTYLERITVAIDPDPMVLCLTGTGLPDSGTIVTTAHYSDGSSAVVTPDLYDGYNAGVVSVDVSGNVSSVGVGTTTITVHYEDKTADVPVEVKDCTPPCISADLSFFSLEIKEGGSWTEYLGSVYPFDPSTTVYYVTTTNFAEHFKFTVDAECEGEASLYYNWYRGISCTDDWLTGESEYSDPPPSWIPITSGGTYPTAQKDRPVCNKGGNVLFIKVTNAGSPDKIYKVYVDRPNPQK